MKIEIEKNFRIVIICLVIALATIIWAVGVGTNLFADPAFSSFWWLSRTDATAAALIFVPAIMAGTLISGEYFWFNRKQELN